MVHSQFHWHLFTSWMLVSHRPTAIRPEQRSPIIVVITYPPARARSPYTYLLPVKVTTNLTWNIKWLTSWIGVFSSWDASPPAKQRVMALCPKRCCLQPGTHGGLRGPRPNMGNVCTQSHMAMIATAACVKPFKDSMWTLVTYICVKDLHICVKTV